jgi:hypothetical protein
MLRQYTTLIKTIGVCAITILVAVSANVTAEPQGGRPTASGKPELAGVQSDTKSQVKIRRYPYGYQFYRHGRGHRHGPIRGYYFSTILSAQD